MDHEELAGEIYSIFHPEPVARNEGAHYYETPPSSRLRTQYGLDTSYWEPFEFGSSSELMRTAANDEDPIAAVIQAQQVPFELFLGTLRLFGDSILAYHSASERKGPYRYYPAVLMSAWASFEAFVRVYSELLVKTVPSLPVPVRLALLETEERVADKKGALKSQRRMQPLLDRYWWLLKFGYGVEYPRGNRIWQMGMAAISKRNALVHYEISELPSLTMSEICAHLEGILRLLIGPSVLARRSIMPNVYELYGAVEELRPLVQEFEERPFHKGWTIRPTGVIFPCPFDNIDDGKYPVSGARLRRKRTERGES